MYITNGKGINLELLINVIQQSYSQKSDFAVHKPKRS